MKILGEGSWPTFFPQNHLASMHSVLRHKNKLNSRDPYILEVFFIYFCVVRHFCVGGVGESEACPTFYLVGYWIFILVPTWILSLEGGVPVRSTRVRGTFTRTQQYPSLVKFIKYLLLYIHVFYLLLIIVATLDLVPRTWYPGRFLFYTVYI